MVRRKVKGLTGKRTISSQSRRGVTKLKGASKERASHLPIFC